MKQNVICWLKFWFVDLKIGRVKKLLIQNLTRCKSFDSESETLYIFEIKIYTLWKFSV